MHLFGLLRRIAVMVSAVALALLAGACGIKGPLDPPSAAQESGTAKSAEAGNSGENTAAKPKPHEPFVLDGLIR